MKALVSTGLVAITVLMGTNVFAGASPVGASTDAVRTAVRDVRDRQFARRYFEQCPTCYAAYYVRRARSAR